MDSCKRWNATVGPYFAIATLAKLGTFFHISINGFGTCVGAFYPLKVLQQPLGTKRVYGYLQEMKCCSWALFYHCRTCRNRHFLSYKRQWFWNLYWSISPILGASTPPQYRGGVWIAVGDEMFYHCHTCWPRYFFSYKRQWFWDLCWRISPPWYASTASRYRGGVWAPQGDEMLQLDLILPLPH